MRRRVVVTGIGMVSGLGNDPDTVSAALRAGTSGIRPVTAYAEKGLACQVAGLPDISAEPPIGRRWRRYMGAVAQYGYHAMRRAVEDAGLSADQLQHPRTGLVVGSGTGSLIEHHEALEIRRVRGAQRIVPYIVPRVMGNTVSASLAAAFGIQGASYAITSACASGSHCIGQGADLIRLGRQDTMIVGGAEEAPWTSAVMFEAMGALSARNDATASRPFDASRDGFVLGAGAGVLVLEALDLALARGAGIYAEVGGYGATTDGMDMVNPDPSGIARAMRLALDEAQCEVGYVNAHATSTRVGDAAELQALREVFGMQVPPFSSTKGQTGHTIAAAGALEAVFCMLMMRDGFVPGCTNLQAPDEAAAGLPLLRVSRECAPEALMSNSMGFGGTNASLVFQRFRSS